MDNQTAEEWKLQGNDRVKKGDHAAAYECYSKGLEVEPGRERAVNAVERIIDRFNG